MGLSFDEFKEFVRKREFNDFRNYLDIIQLVEEFYNEDQIKLFYPKNVYNNKEKELVFFLEEGYFIVKIVDDKYVIQQQNCRLTSKSLRTYRHHNHEQYVRLEFDNGDLFEFNSLKDSNEKWEYDYSIAIRNIYKNI